MNIRVKCFATLDTFQPEDPENFPISEGETVAQVMERLGVPAQEVHVIFVNSRHVDPDTVLKHGDKLGLFPAVGGG